MSWYNRRRRGLILIVAMLALLPSHAMAGMPFPTKDGGIPTLAPIMKRVTPAVVNISVLSQMMGETNPLLRDPFFRRFFDLPETPRSRPVRSAGSGVIVDAAKGYVLTNNHVIENAKEILVTLKDRRKYKAELIGRDPATDVALLRIDATGLTALHIGDSDQLEVGDFVVAIGNPFGLGQTVTSGVVSALGRSGLNIEGFEDFIQTDASINPGNSGGALVNLKGELVGLNTAIIGPSGGNVGIGFAVPSNMARSVTDHLIAHGEVRRGQLGVIIQDLTPELAEALGVERAEGAVVTQVLADSAAERARIRPGDVVIEIDGRSVEDSSDLKNRVGLLGIGQRVTIKLIRDGKVLLVKPVIGENPTTSVLAGETAPQLAGAVFTNPDQGKGVLVEEVQPSSPAARNGLRQGDRILAVNRRVVRTIDDLRNALEAAGRAIGLTVLRGNIRLFLVIQ